MRKLSCLILAVLWLQLSPMRAQNAEFPNAIHAKLNFFDYGTLNNEDLRLSQGFEIGYFRNIAPFLNVGLPVKFGLAKLPGVTENTVTTSLDLVFHLGNMHNDARISPYAFGGTGYYMEDFSNGHLQFPFGAGLNFRISKYAFINVQAEYRKATKDKRDNAQTGLGFVYLLHKPDPKALPPVQPKVADRDLDGTADTLDKCPDQPGPASALGCPDADGDGLGDHEDGCPGDAGSLDTKGCPDTDSDGFPDKEDECPTTAGRWNGCPDSDFDGVADKNDRCPNEAGPSSNSGCPEVKDMDNDGVEDKYDRCPDKIGPASNDGCPEVKDADNDGVADNDDKCPNSAGPVSNFGCPEVKQETRERLQFATRAVQFESGKAILKSQSFPVLDEFVDIMRQYPDYTLSISGYSDNVGDENKNFRLSQSRAKTCYDYLIFRGIKAERLRYAGFGEERPIAPNNTAEGREQNRRVEFELVLDK